MGLSQFCSAELNNIKMETGTGSLRRMLVDDVKIRASHITKRTTVAWPVHKPMASTPHRLSFLRRHHGSGINDSLPLLLSTDSNVTTPKLQVVLIGLIVKF